MPIGDFLRISLGALMSGSIVFGPATIPVEEHGIDIAAINASTRPGDNFNDYANGRWASLIDIPTDQSSWGSFTSLREKADKRTADLIADMAEKPDPNNENAQKIGDIYASFMDEAAIEAKGIEPLRPQMQKIAAISSRAELARAFGASLRSDVDALNNTNFFTENLFGLWVAQGFSDPDHYWPYLLQGGLGMTDRSYYLAGNAKMAALRAAYREHIAAILSLAGIADAAEKAERILALERRIAAAHISRADSEDVHKANNPWTRDEFAVKAPGMDWNAFFDAAGLSRQENFIVWQPSAVTGIASIVADTPLDVWKDYLTFHLLNHYSSFLPRAFVAERFAFYGKALLGTPEQRDRWTRAVDVTNSEMGDAVGRIYVARYFPPEAKATAEKMVRNIMAAFGRRIDALDWMSPQTKARSREKLATLYVGIGYPERWRDYSRLTILRGDALGNQERAELFDYHRSVEKLGQAVDRSEWCMTPQTVNAVNMPLQNALNFPAAILDRPFFDPRADDAFNYGAIGSVIGHEISHSFDDQGSQFDAQGKLADWWTPADFAHFQASAKRLEDQYNLYRPFADVSVNGAQTLSENIADVAGLSAAYDGWRAEGGERHVREQGFTPTQIFFLAYGQSRQQKTRDAAMRQEIISDSHAPSEFRAQAVRNIDAWYDAFDVTADEALYLAPEDRVRIW